MPTSSNYWVFAAVYVRYRLTLLLRDVGSSSFCLKHLAFSSSRSVIMLVVFASVGWGLFGSSTIEITPSGAFNLLPKVQFYFGRVLPEHIVSVWPFVTTFFLSLGARWIIWRRGGSIRGSFSFLVGPGDISSGVIFMRGVTSHWNSWISHAILYDMCLDLIRIVFGVGAVRNGVFMPAFRVFSFRVHLLFGWVFVWLVLHWRSVPPSDGRVIIVPAGLSGSPVCRSFRVGPVETKIKYGT